MVAICNTIAIRNKSRLAGQPTVTNISTPGRHTCQISFALSPPITSYSGQDVPDRQTGQVKAPVRAAMQLARLDIGASLCVQCGSAPPRRASCGWT
jgi:hypothetical protein